MFTDNFLGLLFLVTVLIVLAYAVWQWMRTQRKKGDRGEAGRFAEPPGHGVRQRLEDTHEPPPHRVPADRS